jgi:hypothetical protein
VDVRIQIPQMRVDRHGVETIAVIAGLGTLLILGACCSILIAVIAAVSLAGLIIGVPLLIVEPWKISGLFGRKKLKSWFEDAVADLHLQGTKPTPPAQAFGNVRVATLRLRSNNVFHAKMVVDRNVEAVLLGSPFEQQYFDSQHLLEEPRRGGNAKKGPIHEMSVAVRGPAVGHLQEVFNSHWNVADPSDTPLPVPPVPPTAPADLKTGEFRCAVQIVRTFDKMFAPATNGEKGVLEAYLRASTSPSGSSTSRTSISTTTR